MAEKASDQAKDAERKQDQAKDAAGPVLVEMEKDGVSMDVHPDCVAAHEAKGWRVAG